jgi:hypothetical protein
MQRRILQLMEYSIVFESNVPVVVVEEVVDGYTWPCGLG